jgi:acetolactate synthase-1/2/3 large subunit
MKLSDYVAQFLAELGIRHVFAIAGGASLHLIDSLAKTEGTSYICPQHEQASAMAADAYSRVTGKLGAAVATSGPGATNMITGVCCAYYDSVPVLYITGQVSTFRQKRNSGVRQIGFQETDVVDMFKPVVKYAVLVNEAEQIRYELEKAVHIATTGRPGPVLVDIPDNLQRAEVDPNLLPAFVPEPQDADSERMVAYIDQCLPLLQKAERPILIAGWGIRLAGALKDALELVESLGYPVVPTWAMADFLPAGHPLLVGTFGTHGTRFGNFAVQNADLILAIGTRLDTHEAGSPLSSFARGAEKIVVDIDVNEVRKFATFGLPLKVAVEADAGEFIRALRASLSTVTLPPIDAWKERITDWKTRYPACAPEYADEPEVNPYRFVDALSEVLAEGDHIFIDTGCALAWMMQGFKAKPGQRLFHAFNNTAMGYALPAAIGGCLALDKAPVTCVTGDGSLQMNIQELATVLRHNLPIKIFLINNHGYSMIQQTQDQWLDSRYEGSSVEGGLAFPDFVKVAQAYGYKTVNIQTNDQIADGIRVALDTPGPVFCNVEILPEHRVIPQVKFGRAIEDSEPLLSREEFFAQMIVPPLPASME